MEKTEPALLQYGALGLFLIVALYWARILYTRAMDDQKEAIAREVARANEAAARADRLENELRDLNAAIRNDILPVLADTRRAIDDSHQVMQTALAEVRRS